ncbi:MAG: hypothetical protein ACRD3D_09390 [Terriglobia bacterium]
MKFREWGQAASSISRTSARQGGVAFAVAVTLAAGVCPARSASSASQVQIPLIVAKGVPLRVVLSKRVPIHRAGERVEGRLAAPVYVYDRAILPADTEVLGRIARVDGAPRLARARAMMNGNFTPLRTATVEFDALVLKGGERVSISTMVQPGAAPAIELVSGGKKKSGIKEQARGALAGEREQIAAEKAAVLDAVRRPGKVKRLELKLKQAIVAESPYHRLAFQPGTVFTAVLMKPLDFGVATLPASEIAHVGDPPPPDCTLRARLLTPLDSATARQGAPVEAVVTEPLFSSSHELIIPQGARLEGTVVRAKPARRLHRDGNLRFTFQRLEPPAAPAEIIQASVERIQVARASHLKLDAEGGAAPAPSKKKYIAPAVSLMLALDAANPEQDVDTDQGITTTTMKTQGGVAGQALSGGWGLGLVGSAVTLAAHSTALTTTLGFYGAAWSVYSNLLARGRNVSFPANTPMVIELGSHRRRAANVRLPDLHLPAMPRP